MNAKTIALSAAAALACATLVTPQASARDQHRNRTSNEGIIVWTTREASGSEHLMVARADGSHQRSLTPELPDTGDVDAQISPDGSWVAYERDTADSASVRLVRPDGRQDDMVDVGCSEPCVAAIGPTWLTNTRLSFALVKAPFGQPNDSASSAVLWTSRRDGTHVRRLSRPGIDGVYEDLWAHRAPDGSYLTFLRRRNADLKSALFRMRPDGTHEQQLTPWDISADVNDLSTARLGPTKDLLVFDSYARGGSETSFVDIGTVPATCPDLQACTASIRWLTDNGATGRRNANPQWSPDGTSLVFTDRASIDEPNAEIWTMRYPGTDRRKISTSTNFDYRPTWGPRP